MSKVDLKVWDIKTFIFIIRTSSGALEIQKDWTGSTESWPKHSELLKFLFPPSKNLPSIWNHWTKRKELFAQHSIPLHSNYSAIPPLPPWKLSQEMRNKCRQRTESGSSRSYKHFSKRQHRKINQSKSMCKAINTNVTTALTHADCKLIVLLKEWKILAWLTYQNETF